MITVFDFDDSIYGWFSLDGTLNIINYRVIGLNTFHFSWTIEAFTHSFGGLATRTEPSPSLMTFSEEQSQML